MLKTRKPESSEEPLMTPNNRTLPRYALFLTMATSGIMSMWIANRPLLLTAQAQDPFVGRPSPEAERLIAQDQADQRRITIRQANLFHARFIETVMDDLPRNVTVRYVGLLATDHGRGSLRAPGGIGIPLGWHVQDETLVRFSFWISTKPTTETITKTMIEGQELFVNVDQVDGNRGVDTPLPELGGLSVRNTLAKLHEPWPKKDD
jgi:hypothetical protein